VPVYDLEVAGTHTYLVGGHVVHNCHHVPCQTLLSVLGALPARRRYGLTATPERDDGLTPLMHWALGPTISTIEHRDLASCGSIVLPTVRRVDTGWSPPAEEASWASLISAMTEDPARNALIAAEVSAAVAAGRQVLVLSERVGHCRALATRLGGEPLVGEATPKRRADLLDRARSGSLRVVCGTTVADEGLDIPGLDTVLLATPCRALGRIEQRIGRSMRPCDGKPPPQVIDLVDAWGPALGAWRRRAALYQRLGLTPRPADAGADPRPPTTGRQPTGG